MKSMKIINIHPKTIEEIINFEGLEKLVLSKNFSTPPRLREICLSDGSKITGNTINLLASGHSFDAIKVENGYREIDSSLFIKERWVKSKSDSGCSLVEISWERFLELVGSENLYFSDDDHVHIDTSQTSRRDSLGNLEQWFNYNTYYEIVQR